MKHHIMCTAGHVDHGKTSLIKALTGYDCDTHANEKTRGITINLGFTSMKTPHTEIGIVDTPGHLDFINTMIAGASGVDIALLVVAADAGVSTQTREHLHIMNCLGIQNGIIALTKIDLVDAEIIDICTAEIRELCAGTFLDNAPLALVSVYQPGSVEKLKSLLFRLAKKNKQAKSDVFRMYIDRLFSVQGLGIVVAGSVIGGRLSAHDKVYLLPGEKELKIRSIERYHGEVDTITAGDRASLNITGFPKNNFKRGQLIASSPLAASRLLDVRLHFFDNYHGGQAWLQVVFLAATYRCQARIHLLTKTIESESTWLAQLYLADDFVCLAGDKFIVRSTDGKRSLGGGEIIDNCPLHHRQAQHQLVQELNKLSTANFASIVANELRKQQGIITKDDLLVALWHLKEDKQAELSQLDSVILQGDIIISKELYNTLVPYIKASLAKYHRQHHLDPLGMTFGSLKQLLPKYLTHRQEMYTKAVLAQMLADDYIKVYRQTYCLSTHNVLNDDDFISMQKSFIAQLALLPQHYLTPERQTLIMHKLAISKSQYQAVLGQLLANKEVVKVADFMITQTQLSTYHQLLTKAFHLTPAGLSVASYRDVINANRKLTMALFSYFEKENVIVRQGDLRIPTQKLKKLL